MVLAICTKFNVLEASRLCVCLCVCVFVSSCQATKVLISKYLATRRVVVSVGGGEWVGKATAYKFDTGTLIGVHSTMHLVDPMKVHV